ncbi:FUSC family protein [Craterilacuibacter sp. RT1T]|uniref:FUSC family protein n=1 Tax=Craterilacuibacter sp. RT1T TaxID=2942211 RepID=UPI0020BFF948|nr:FUSC family protein [Craterilacuibacter sp. RT1T]
MSIKFGKLDFIAAIRIMLLLILTGACGYVLGGKIPGASAEIGRLWAVISGIVVLQASSDETIKAASKRVLGTLIGATVGWLYLTLLPNNWAAGFICVFLTILLSQLLGVPDNGRLGCVTVLVVLVVSALHPGLPPLVNASLRFFEAAIGSGIALLLAWLWPHPDMVKP